MALCTCSTSLGLAIAILGMMCIPVKGYFEVVHCGMWVKGSAASGYSQKVHMNTHHIAQYTCRTQSLHVIMYPHQMCPPGHFDLPNYSTCPLPPWPPSQPSHYQQVTTSNHYHGIIYTHKRILNSLVQCNSKEWKVTIVKDNMDSKSTSLNYNASNKKDTSQN